MADENVIGRITGVEGGGDVLIIRASGEQVFAKPGDAILEGDTVFSPAGRTVRAVINKDGIQGVVAISDSDIARFDHAVLDNAAALIQQSSEEDPVNIGSKPTVEVLNQINETLPSAGIQTANEQSQSSRVVHQFGRKECSVALCRGAELSIGGPLRRLPKFCE